MPAEIERASSETIVKEEEEEKPPRRISQQNAFQQTKPTNQQQEAQARLQRALIVAKHATAAANEATAAVEAASSAAAASADTAECYARAAGVPVSSTAGGDGDPFVISARAAARAARLARVEVEAASEAARAAIEAAAKRAAAVVIGPGGASDGRGVEGRELALVEEENNGDNGDEEDEEEGDYGNGFVDLNGNGDRDQVVGEEEEEEEGDAGGDGGGGKRKRGNVGRSSKGKRPREHQQFSASSPPPPRPLLAGEGGKKGKTAAVGGANDDDSDGDDDENPAGGAAAGQQPRRRFHNGLGCGNGVYFDGGDGTKVRFRVSVTVAIPEDAAAKLGLPVSDADRRLVESRSSASKSMPLVFIEKTRFEDSGFVYGRSAAEGAALMPSSAALAKARAARPADERARQLRQLFFPQTTQKAQAASNEFVFRGRHRAWVMRFFVYPPNNKRQITSGLSPLIRDCFGSQAATLASSGGRGAGESKTKKAVVDESKRLSNLWELVVWRGQDNNSSGGGGRGGGKGKGKGRRGDGGDEDDDENRTDEPGSVVLPSGERVPALWIEFDKLEKK